MQLHNGTMSRAKRLNTALTAALYSECNTMTNIGKHWSTNNNRNTSDEQNTKYTTIKVILVDVEVCLSICRLSVTNLVLWRKSQ